MLGFFRKYQRYFFAVITVVIVISFSFFGTYSTLQRNQYVDTTAFTTVDGTEIKRQELETLALFIGTDNEDKLLFGGAWGPNFLNDGVIKKDFLETGLAEILVAPYLNEIKIDLQPRHLREKHYKTYVHPHAKFVSAINAWSIVAPDIGENLLALQTLEDPATPEGFETRVKLFLAERRFPHPILRQVLRHQQRQYNWISSDPNLDRIDLALFGYYTLNDWFGPRLNRLVAEFIINAAIIAEQRGYEVSKEEALADLYRNAERSFQQNANNPKLGVASTDQYFAEQLRRMGLDQNKAVSLWRKVMAFRRLFKDLGSSVFVDPLTIQQFHEYVTETVEGDLYKLPDTLRFGDYHSLQKFETYLDAVANRPKEGMELLDVPESYKSAEEVVQNHPELVHRRFLLDVSKVEKKDLQVKVGVKETWNWEVQDDNWKKLKEKFPELGVKKGDNKEERFAALDQLDGKTRARVDAFAREEIVNEHPEWLSQALLEASTEKQIVGIRQKGDSAAFKGLKDPQQLIILLDKYPESQEALSEYTADGNTYYRITVLDRSTKPEVLTFAEADESGTIDEILNRQLEAHYEAIRERDSKTFRNEDGSWKPLPQVRLQVADSYFAKILDQIRKYYAEIKTPGQQPQPMIGDFAASQRFYAFMQGLRERFSNNSKNIQEWVKEIQPQKNDDTLPPREGLEEQWKIVKTEYKADRSTENFPIDKEEAYALKSNEWSKVHTRANGEITFFQLKRKGPPDDLPGLHEKVMQTQQLLSVDAQKILMRHLLEEMEAKNALSLKYLVREEREEEGEE